MIGFGIGGAAERMSRAACIALAAGFALHPAVARAQASSGVPPSPAATAAGTRSGQAEVPRPDRTTASYGDWVLRCEHRAGSDDRACEVAYTRVDARGQAVMQLTLSRSADPGQILVVGQVPVSATVSEPARLITEERPALALAFRTCSPRGCFIEAQWAAAEMQSLAGQPSAARLEYRDGEGGAVAVPMSLRGLAAALDALQRVGRD